MEDARPAAGRAVVDRLDLEFGRDPALEKVWRVCLVEYALVLPEGAVRLVAEKTGLSRSTVHRRLAVLAGHRWVGRALVWQRKGETR